MLKTLKCKICKIEFKTTNSRQKYCGSRKNKTGCSFNEFKGNYKEYYSSTDRKKYVIDYVRNKKYNITTEIYEDIARKQKNLCYICNKPEMSKNRNGEIRTLSVDHNHITGKYRKLLCSRCNSAIGYAQEDVKILKRMIVYLTKHK